MKAIIIEDEKSSMVTLTNLLSDYCKGISIVGNAYSVSEGVNLMVSI